MAKISSRLVEGQDPPESLEKIKRYLRSAAPVGTRVEILDESVGGKAFRLSVHAPVVKKACEAIARSFSREPVYLWEGASVPIIPQLASVSGGAPILVGFGMEEDRIHSPNESFSLRQFEEGFRYSVAFLQVV
jgi:acetylornithine deacetylase/succinyl-diaminopimelate desuccinylase-like protein